MAEQQMELFVTRKDESSRSLFLVYCIKDDRLKVLVSLYCNRLTSHVRLKVGENLAEMSLQGAELLIRALPVAVEQARAWRAEVAQQQKGEN